MSKYKNFIISCISIILFLYVAYEAQAGTAPSWTGYVRTRTGAPVAGAIVKQSNDTAGVCWASSVDENGNPTGTECLAASNQSRTTTTDQNGFYSFQPEMYYQCASNPQVFQVTVSGGTCPTVFDRPGNMDRHRDLDIVCDVVPSPTPTPTRAPVCNQPCTAFECQGAWDGCTACVPNINGTRTCQPPPTATPTQAAPTPTPTPTACNAPCDRPADCLGAINGCTYCLPNNAGQRVCSPPRQCNQPCERPDDCQSAEGCGSCLPDGSGRRTCQPPPRCGSACSDDSKCIGAPNGCTSCVPNNAGEKVCAPPPKCGDTCLRDDQCAGARDGCTACVPNNAGTGKVCSPPPACGTNCARDDQCAGARDGCTFCNSGKCSAFKPEMCSCDGMDFIGTAGGTFFPGDNVTFIAYGKVPGKDWKGTAAAAIRAAEITSAKFTLYESKTANLNDAVMIAQSTAIAPVITENTADKVRYKITWNQRVPSSPPAGSLYRIQAKLTCAPKPGILGAYTSRPANANYFTQLFDTVAARFAKGSVLGQNDERTGFEQQLLTFTPAAKIIENKCDFILFSFE